MSKRSCRARSVHVRGGFLTKYLVAVVGILGAVMFAAGLGGAMASLDAAHAAWDAYTYDCMLYPSSPDCTQREVVMGTYNAQIVMYGITGVVGFLFLLGALVMGFGRGKRRKVVRGRTNLPGAR